MLSSPPTTREPAQASRRTARKLQFWINAPKGPEGISKNPPGTPQSVQTFGSLRLTSMMKLDIVINDVS